MGTLTHSQSREHSLEERGGTLRCSRCAGRFHKERAAQFVACIPTEEQHSELVFTRAGEL